MLFAQDDKKWLIAALLAVALSIPCVCPTAARADEAAWEVLAGAREGLAEAPLEARFVQTYVPAGFSTGDEESGTLSLALPGCLRWDYEDPYPRNYLLCARTVWVWSPDEAMGDRYLEVSRDEAGLDFLLLSVERLRERYEAELDRSADGEVRIALTVLEAAPSAAVETAFTHAEIVLDETSGRPSRLAYTDREGNRTAFELGDYSPLESTARFEAPSDIEWIDAE